MPFVMRVLGYAREHMDCAFADQYLEWYDPNIPDGSQVMALFTDDIAKAKTFPSVDAAMAEWNRVRANDPIRPDGKLNKPLTALTVSIERREES